MFDFPEHAPEENPCLFPELCRGGTVVFQDMGAALPVKDIGLLGGDPQAGIVLADAVPGHDAADPVLRRSQHRHGAGAQTAQSAFHQADGVQAHQGVALGTAQQLRRQIAELRDGRLHTDEMASADDYLWIEGILSLNTPSFTKLAARLERIYDVRIMTESSEPVVKNRGKIRTADGLEHALRLILAGTGHSFEIDYETKQVHIR